MTYTKEYIKEIFKYIISEEEQNNKKENKIQFLYDYIKKGKSK